ncbi:MAG: E3 binding domain-containing protein, partial [Chloroflexota bacterium]|nr:E3 binding domain-containing protein [Chloroflexota bacterium]
MNLAMPRLSDTMEEGTLGRWLKHEGETIEKGEVIAEIQTDKANMELEAFQGGVLEKILVQEGETVPIGQAIAVIGTGQDGAQRHSQASEPAQATQPQVTARPAQEPAPQPAAQPATEPARPAAKGPEGRIKASPLARRLAHEHGLELAQIPGTGPNGRITRDDVQQAAASHPAPEQAAPSRAPEPTV